MALFSGLEKLGLGKLEKMDVYEEEAKKAAEKEAAAAPGAKPAAPKINEEEILFDKKNTCPVCNAEFTSKVIRTGRTKMVKQDTDLRPQYQPVDSLKYDALVCPKCGYAALSRFFKYATQVQAQLIRENISKNFNGLQESGPTYTYDDAIMRHQLALANAVVKKAAASERAYTCLKLAWLCRGKAETLDKGTENYQQQIDELAKEEAELLANAYDGFSAAFMNESFPMCGMDELTVTYLMADLARRVGKYDESSRWVSRVLTSKEANERVKEKARTVKELLNEEKEGK